MPPLIGAQVRLVETEIPGQILVSQRIFVSKGQIAQHVLAVGVVLGMLLRIPLRHAASQLSRRHVNPQLLGFAVQKGKARLVVVPLIVAVTPRKRRLEGGDEEEERKRQDAV